MFPCLSKLRLTLLAFVLIAWASCAIAQDRTQSSGVLDEESTFLSLLRIDDGFSLQWMPSDTLHYWCVTFSTEESMTDLDTLAITTDTFYVHRDAEGIYTLGFFRVDPIDIVPPADTTDVIESFTSVPVMFGISGQDFEPTGFSISDSDFFGAPGNSLHMFGNTWKRINIFPRHVDSTDVWAIAAKLLHLGEVHAFGVADSANYMYYVIWGKEAPQSQNWLTVYEGWYDSLEWVDIMLPIGEDWQGRFGYAPNITELRFINDNDTVATDGQVVYDEIRNVTGALPLDPVAEFQWSVVDNLDPDSISVSFHSFAYDLDSPYLNHRWDFGDGYRSTESNPLHAYPSHGRYPVTLTVTADDGQASWVTDVVVDSPVTATRDMWFAFTGDVILGRGYENAGGIIESWGVDTLFAPTLAWTQAADLVSMNLECPLTTATERHPTKGIVFKSRPEQVSGLVNAGVDFVTVANNHVFDYLIPGMIETMSVLDSAGIVNNGAGMNDELARQPRFLSSNGISFGMLSFSDRTGSYNNVQPFLDASRSRPGFAMWNRAAIDATVEEACALSDFVVINTHSGDEYLLAPVVDMPSDPDFLGDEGVVLEVIPDTLQRQMRQYAIERGAELVISHHPHIIQGLEVYNGKLIAHSLGNFIFDLTMAETMPSMILSAHFDGDVGVDTAIVHPVYINHWIPQRARGELARNILDYETEMTRRLNTWLIRPPGADSAFIVFDTMAVTRVGVDSTDTLALHQDGAWWTSGPHKLPLDGYIVNADILNAAGCQIRFGREKLYYGNMENEGANDWLLNGGDEGYVTDFAHGGSRSIRLRRTSPNPQPVVSNNEFRLPIQVGQSYSICGWVRSENAGLAVYQAQFFGQRSGGTSLAQVNIGAPLAGTSDWVFRDKELNPPAGSTFIEMREYLSTPATGTGYAWFDDVSLIQWEAWQNLPATAVFPSDFHYVEVRNSSNVGSVALDYRLEWVVQVPVAFAEESR